MNKKHLRYIIKEFKRRVKEAPILSRDWVLEKFEVLEDIAKR